MGQDASGPHHELLLLHQNQPGRIRPCRADRPKAKVALKSWQRCCVVLQFDIILDGRPLGGLYFLCRNL